MKVVGQDPSRERMKVGVKSKTLVLLTQALPTPPQVQNSYLL